MKVEILCPTEWSDGICDPYDSRVYLEKDISDTDTQLLMIVQAINWIATDAMKYLCNLDPEYHGSRFEIYINHEYKGDIYTTNKTFDMSFTFRSKI